MPIQKYFLHSRPPKDIICSPGDIESPAHEFDQDRDREDGVYGWYSPRADGDIEGADVCFFE
jgi:hypothetical protein